MTSKAFRRCCDKGCGEIRRAPADDDGWYKCSVGYMQWACPEHAAKWRAYCVEIDEYQAAHSAAWQRDYSAWCAEWEARMDRELPRPAEPDVQSSIIYEETS